MPKKVSVKQSVKASKVKTVSQQQKTRNVKQNQKVVVNITGSKGSRRPRSAPSQTPKPNSIGYSVNSQVYSLPQPSFMDYNSALAGMNALQANQMKTGSLIPNQQVNSLYSTIRATPRQESLGDNPFRRPTRNTQVNMLNPHEGEMEGIVEFVTTSNAYDPDPNGQISVGVGQTLGDLPAGIVKVGASDEMMIKEMSASLKGLKSKVDNFALGERASQSIASSITPLPEYQKLEEKAMSNGIDQLIYYDDANLEENLGKEVEATITPAKRKYVRKTTEQRLAEEARKGVKSILKAKQADEEIKKIQSKAQKRVQKEKPILSDKESPLFPLKL